MTERKPRLLAAEALWDYALRALGGRAHSRSELREKLRRRAERAADVDTVLSRLREYGYLDDRRFAAEYASRRLESQGFGQGRVLRDLQQKKVARGVAEQAVREAFSDTNEAELAEKFLRRKFRKVELYEYLAEPRNLASAFRRLRIAGFSSGTTLRILKGYAQEPELLESLEASEEPGESG